MPASVWSPSTRADKGRDGPASHRHEGAATKADSVLSPADIDRLAALPHLRGWALPSLRRPALGVRVFKVRDGNEVVERLV
jgi:hypothetical protein